MFPKIINCDVFKQISGNMFVIYLCSDFLIFIARNMLSVEINSNPIFSVCIILPFVIVVSLMFVKIYEYRKQKNLP